MGLGLFQKNAREYLKGKKAVAVEKMAIDPEKVRQLIDARAMARKNKDWAQADQIRDQLAHMHVILEDRPEGTSWKIEENNWIEKKE